MIIKSRDVQKDQYSKGVVIPNNSSGVLILGPSLYSSRTALPMRVYVMIYFDLDPGAAAAGAPIFNGWAGCMPEWM